MTVQISGKSLDRLREAMMVGVGEEFLMSFHSGRKIPDQYGLKMMGLPYRGKWNEPLTIKFDHYATVNWVAYWHLTDRFLVMVTRPTLGGPMTLYPGSTYCVTPEFKINF